MNTQSAPNDSTEAEKLAHWLTELALRIPGRSESLMACARELERLRAEVAELKDVAERIYYRAECWPDSPHAKGDGLREQVLAHVLKRGAGTFNLADEAVVPELVALVRHFGGASRP